MRIVHCIIFKFNDRNCLKSLFPKVLKVFFYVLFPASGQIPYKITVPYSVKTDSYKIVIVQRFFIIKNMTVAFCRNQVFVTASLANLRN